MSECTTELLAIVEVENGKYQRLAGSRYEAARYEIQRSRIHGHAVVCASTEYEEPTQIAYFNYSASSTPPASIPPYGVSRYFGFSVFVEGDYSLLTHRDTIFQVTPYAQLHITGSGPLMQKGKNDLKPIAGKE